MYSLPSGYPADTFGAFELLKSRSSLSIDDIKVLALIECSGELLYETLAAAVDDAESKALLRRNGQEERGHAHRMLKVLRLKGEEWELPSDADNPYIRSAPSELPANADFFGMIQQAEADGDLVYQRWADAEQDPEVAKLLRLNGREETRHGERVATVLGRLASLTTPSSA